VVVVAFLAIVVAAAVLAPWIAPFDPNAQDLTLTLRPPSWYPHGVPGHVLGTDQLGRDVLSRTIFGARVSLVVGACATALAAALGTVIGLVAGYFGGIRDGILMRLADVQLAFPSILLALALIAVIGPSIPFLILVLGGTSWVSYARVVRAEVMTLRTREFVVAARAIGVRDHIIIRRHLLPNVMAPLATLGTLQVASLIIAQASLSYLGLGVPPSVPAWGSMLQEGQLYLRTAWWLGVFPGLAIILVTLAINIGGDLLRDVADPKAYVR
jgi:peptide/nickel transport system permease protein